MTSLIPDHLFTREPGIMIVRVGDLKAGLPEPGTDGLRQLYIVLADIGFIRSLSRLDERHPAVQAVMDAWAVGIELHIVIHRQMLSLLPARELATMPLSLSDHEGRVIEISSRKLLSYADVALLGDCWLLTPRHVRISEMAMEFMAKHKIEWVEVS